MFSHSIHINHSQSESPSDSRVNGQGILAIMRWVFSCPRTFSWTSAWLIILLSINWFCPLETMMVDLFPVISITFAYFEACQNSSLFFYGFKRFSLCSRKTSDFTCRSLLSPLKARKSQKHLSFFRPRICLFNLKYSVFASHGFSNHLFFFVVRKISSGKSVAIPPTPHWKSFNFFIVSG